MKKNNIIWKIIQSDNNEYILLSDSDIIKKIKGKNSHDYVTIISICIRTFFNINIFLPSTDGYFVFSDTINKPNLFDYSNKLFKEFIKSRNTKAKNLPYIFYAVIGYLSIFISWCFFFLPLIIYFYYAFKN